MKLRRNCKKWIARVLVVVMMLTCVPIYNQSEVSAAGYAIANNGTGGINIDINNAPFNENWSYGDPYGPGGCTWFVGARVKQLTGKGGNAAQTGSTWYNSYGRSLGFSIGQEIKAPAVVCWRGHVAILEKIDGDTAYLSEGGVGRYKNWGNWQSTQTNNRHCVIHAISKGEIKTWSGIRSDFIGFVYLNGATSNPAPAAQGSVKAVWADKYDHNMVMKAHYYNPGGKRMTVCGITVKDGNTVVARREEMHGHPFAKNGDVWFDINKDCGVTLRAGHVYSWQIYVNIGGTTYYTDWINDRTTGTEKPNVPSFSVPKKDYAVGDAVTVNWGSDANATKGYSLTITQTKGGSYTKTLTTSTYNATSLAFSLPNEGEYRLTGFARGSENSATSTLNKTIVAHAPSKVRFVEEDKEGKENLLCEQEVKYGYSAQAPNGISRKGHTFTGWRGEYSNVTSDRTIIAQFKRNTYKVVFYDKDDNIIDTQSVLYEDDAKAPTPPEAESGYVFAGWDNEDYKNVQGNVKVKACYVWANNDLPVVVSINNCEFREDGYIVSYNIKNNPNARTKGRALFSLRTSTGKLINTTESDAFSLAKGEERKNVEMYIPYDGVATNISLYIIDRFSNGIPYSATVTAEIDREWSDWSGNNPGSDVEVETRKEYRYRDLLTTTTRTSSNDGWTLAKSVLDSVWTYGNWSGWSRSRYNTSSTTTATREVQTRSVSDNNGYTVNTYYYWKHPSKLAFSYYNEGGFKYYEYTQSTNDSQPKMYVYGSYNGHTTYRLNNNNYGYGVNFNSEVWFLKSSTNIPATSHTEYRYRDGIKGYTYYWNKWDNWTDWLDTAVASNNSREVETRTAYRYRAKMSDLEDNSGKKYTVSGKLDSSLAGKEALIQVYKGDEPSDSNNEYIGRVTIESDGSYSHTFVARQEISARTGDYTVMMAIEGGSEPVYLDTIEAPKPEYTVLFKDINGNIIKKQTVTEGKSATAPEAPKEENYTFVGWDFGVTNIRDDMEITAQYTKNKYSVAFVDWEAEEVETAVFEYGDPVTYPDVTAVEGYEFVGWTTINGEKCDTVTDNLVFVANHEIKKYTVRFFDIKENVISTQQVKYGEDALEPEVEEIDKMEFTGWNSYEFNQVKRDIDVYPVYEYIETASDPVCDTESGVFTESKEIHLTASDNAEIYYTTDGSMPTKSSNHYDGKIVISKNTFLQFIAAEPDKNTSNVISVSFLVSSGEDDDGALVIKKENYNLSRGEETKITYFLSHENNDVGVKFYSLNEDIASVNEEGVISANQVGETQIFVSTTDGKYADYCNVTVTTTDIDAEAIMLNSTSVIGIPDESIQMEAKVYPDEATDKDVDWYIEDESVASVSDTGEITILKKGTTTLKAISKNGSCYAECFVEGVVGYSEDKLQISLPYVFLNENEKEILYTYYGNADINCQWESTNEDVATVDDGMVTAKKAGQAFIIATAEDGTQATSLIVVNKNPDEEIKTDKPVTSETPIPTQKPETNETPKLTQKPTENKTSPKPQLQSAIEKPQKVKGVKVKKSGTKKLQISWKWFSAQDGFEIQYAQNKSFTKGKKTQRYNVYTDRVALKKLKSKKTYYIRIRAYKKNNGKKVYGSWSTVKKCKVK